MSNKKRYQSLSNHKGIWKDIYSKRFQTRKKIKGKQYSETFDTIKECLHWRNTFNGKKTKMSLKKNQLK